MRLKNSLAWNLCLIGMTVSSIAMAGWHPAGEGTSVRQERGNNRIVRLNESLDLTKDQQQKLQSIYESRDKRLQSLYADFRSKRTALQDDTDGKIQALLTAEQREKLKKMQQKKLVERAKVMGEKDSRKQ
jgi:Spy/CpxP family protein refolding chaperone